MMVKLIPSCLRREPILLPGNKATKDSLHRLVSAFTEMPSRASSKVSEQRRSRSSFCPRFVRAVPPATQLLPVPGRLPLTAWEGSRREAQPKFLTGLRNVGDEVVDYLGND
jgi:hypothetical protein